MAYLSLRTSTLYLKQHSSRERERTTSSLAQKSKMLTIPIQISLQKSQVSGLKKKSLKSEKIPAQHTQWNVRIIVSTENFYHTMERTGGLIDSNMNLLKVELVLSWKLEVLPIGITQFWHLALEALSLAKLRSQFSLPIASVLH